MKTPDLGRFKDLSDEARGFISGSDPESVRTQLILELAESLESAVQWIEDDIVNIKEHAPDYLNKRVEEYRSRTWKAENQVEEVREILLGYINTPEDQRFASMALLQIGLAVRRSDG